MKKELELAKLLKWDDLITQGEFGEELDLSEFWDKVESQTKIDLRDDFKEDESGDTAFCLYLFKMNGFYIMRYTVPSYGDDDIMYFTDKEEAFDTYQDYLEECLSNIEYIDDEEA